VSEPVDISSRSNDRVKRLVRLRHSSAAREAGVFLAEGFREVDRARAAGLVFREVYVCPAMLNDRGGLAADQATLSGWDRTFTVARPVMERIALHARPEGVLAVVERPVWLPEQVVWLPDRPRRALILEGVEKPGNVGAMVRTAAAMGCGAVMTVGGCGDPFSAQAIRNSTGAVFVTPVLNAADAEQASAWAHGAGLQTVAAVVPDEPEKVRSLASIAADVDLLRAGLAIVIGSESAGLSAGWYDHADFLTTIAMPGVRRSAGVDSLNAGVAAGMMLYAFSVC
jgi:TrmH family RNA methyltransferase